MVIDTVQVSKGKKVKTGKKENLPDIEGAELLESRYLNKGVIQPRTYQLSIAKKALGKDFMVVLGTSLGKTPIAAIITANTLERHPEGYKVIMVAPTKPLVSQHAESFNAFMNLPQFTEESAVEDCILTGSVKASQREELFEKLQILFYTPQTLRNDLLNNRYNLKKVCLIIFDEAHHASGNHSYCQIADIYREENKDGEVLGLTASPGATREKISALCLALKIPETNIEIRFRNDDDVKDYVPDVRQKLVGVEVSNVIDELYDRLYNGMLVSRFNQLAQLNYLDFQPKDYKKITRSVMFTIQGKASSNAKLKEENAFKALSIIAEALSIYHMIELLTIQSPNILHEYIMELKRNGATTKAKQRLILDPVLNLIGKQLSELQQSKSRDYFHPKYYELRRILLQHFKGDPDSRVLIFTKFRDTVIFLRDQLKKEPLIKVGKFVGQAKKSNRDMGLSQKMQHEILAKFKAGEFNTLIATSVAEEGLDIAECDLVVCYDIPSSPIQLIQRAGRTARKKDGDIILMYTNSSAENIILYSVRNRIKKMRKILEENKGRSKSYELKSNNPSKKKTQITFKTEIPSSKKKLKDQISKEKRLETQSSLYIENNAPKIHELSKIDSINEINKSNIKNTNIIYEEINIPVKNKNKSWYESIDAVVLTKSGIKFKKIEEIPTRIFFPQPLNKNVIIESTNQLTTQINVSKELNEIKENNLKSNTQNIRKNSTSINIYRDLPDKYGLRKVLTNLKIKKQFFGENHELIGDYGSMAPQIYIEKKIAIKISGINELETYLTVLKDEEYLRHHLIYDIDQILRNFEVFVIFIDFIGYDEEESGNKGEYLEKINKLEKEVPQIKIIPIDFPSDITMIIENIMQNFENNL